jgi:DNA ligase-associated metallophosphoesterase
MSAAAEKLPCGPAFARAPCGGLVTRLNGTRVVMRASAALWLPASRTLCAGDLHFEKGSSYAARGQMLPPYDTHETLSRLEAEAEALDPRAIVLLGDSFHDRKAEARMDPDAAARIVRLAYGRELVWIVGNHDADGPRGLPGAVVEHVDIETLHLTHEPHPGHRPGEVAGHLHPCARVSAFGRAVRARCFATDGERLILPAFGAFTGGLSLRDRAFGGLFMRSPTAGVIGSNRVHCVGWEQLL